MTTFTPDRFEAYCSRFPAEFRAEAMAAATITPESVAIPSATLAALGTRYPPLRRPRPAPQPPPPEPTVAELAANFTGALGLGDAVALVAEPIARLSDAVLGTKLVGCGGCAQRRAALNAIVPDVTKPLG